jgi:Abi-like protein
MRFNEIEKHFSQPRINRYLGICGNKTRAQKLHKANIKLSQTFHPLLSTIEVVLRNNVNDAIAAYFGDRDWIINQTTGFMSSRSLQRGRFFLRKQVEKTIQKLRQNNLAVSSGKVISEQTFGFWTDLFEAHHFGLVGRSPTNAFRNLPATENRATVAAKLTKIRKFRNRINHNEPIILHANTIDFTTATAVHSSILEVLGWIDPKLLLWIHDLDKVRQTITRCRKI